MNRTLLAGALSCSLAGLGACTTTGGTSTADIIAQAQAAAVLACAYAPTASAIANIIAAGDPTVATATAIANAVCSAVTRTSVSRSAASTFHVVVNGKDIVVTGEFVR
jgi:hypothetical protein